MNGMRKRLVLIAAVKTLNYARGKVVQWKSGPPMDGKIAKKSTEHHTSNQENVHQCTVL
jgi:hypothetical protein